MAVPFQFSNNTSRHHDLQVEFDENGSVTGVTSEGETAKCKKVVCDPSYLPDKVTSIELRWLMYRVLWSTEGIFLDYYVYCLKIKMLLQVEKVGKVARAVIIMSHPIPDTHESHSAQVIIPQKQLGRKSDMYVKFFSSIFIRRLYRRILIRASLYVSGISSAARIITTWPRKGNT